MDQNELDRLLVKLSHDAVAYYENLRRFLVVRGWLTKPIEDDPQPDVVITNG